MGQMLDLNPLCVRQHVKTKRPDAVVDSLLAMRGKYTAAARFADNIAHKAGLSRLHKRDGLLWVPPSVVAQYI